MMGAIDNPAQHLSRLPPAALDTLYATLSVQTMPVGRFVGIAWMHEHPVLGWIAGLAWRGKVFDGLRVRNRVLGLLLFEGRATLTARDLYIDYQQFGIRDSVRQVTPTLYLGRMRWRSYVVHFTLTQIPS